MNTMNPMNTMNLFDSKGESSKALSKNVEAKSSEVPFSKNTYTTQSFQARDCNYFYDKEYDNLLITFNTSVPTYSDEVHNNIYLIYIYIPKKMIVLLEHRLCILRKDL